MRGAGTRFPAVLVLLAAAPAAAVGTEGPAPVSLTRLRCEYQVDPLSIDVRQPRLSWQLTAEGRGVVQTAIRSASPTTGRGWRPAPSGIRAAWIRTSPSTWSTGGPRWSPGGATTGRFGCGTATGMVSDWSAPASWEMGLLEASDWRPSWISPVLTEDLTAPQPAPMLRTSFAIDGEVQAARAYVTSLGLYEVELNGRRVGDQVFTPGWTSYDTRLQYQTYDVRNTYSSAVSR